VAEHIARKALRKDPLFAEDRCTSKATRHDRQPHLSAAERQVHRRPPIAAVNAAQRRTARRADAVDALVPHEDGGPVRLARNARPKEKPGRDLANVKSIIKCHLRPALGAIRLDHLNADQLKTFKNNLTKAPPLTRSGGPSKAIKAGGDVDHGDKSGDGERERLRKRRSRANRIITTPLAALNYTVRQNLIATDVAWRTALKPYGDVDAATLRYLTLDECKRLQAPSRKIFGSWSRARFRRDADLGVCDSCGWPMSTLRRGAGSSGSPRTASRRRSGSPRRDAPSSNR
jgi:hypothetical protein